MESIPPYPHRHSGPCIVAGSAACLYDDLAKARLKVGEAPVIAVNGAAKLVPAIALYSKHPRRFVERRWLEAQRFHFGHTTTHADVRSGKRLVCVDYWWSGLWGGGGSAWDARKLAASLGFSPVILCGCPMIAGPHVGGLGFASFMHREDVVDGFLRQIEADTEWHKDVYSMSGATRDILGECSL